MWEGSGNRALLFCAQREHWFNFIEYQQYPGHGEAMNRREAMTTALITLGIFGMLGLVVAWHDPGAVENDVVNHRDPLRVIDSERIPLSARAMGGEAIALSETVPVVALGASAAPPEWEILLGWQWKKNDLNEAGCFRLERRGGAQENTFQLYGIAAPPAVKIEGPRLRALEPWAKNPAVLQQRGEEAQAFVASLLQEGSFTAFTRWEKPLKCSQNLAIIFVRRPGAEVTTLQEILVSEGYALALDAKEIPPDQTASDPVMEFPFSTLPGGTLTREWLKRLKLLEQEAQIEHRGGWRL
jgi:endonuclease YncB( thermonuclease family)